MRSGPSCLFIVSMYLSVKEPALTLINSGPASPLAQLEVQSEMPLRPPMIDKILA